MSDVVSPERFFQIEVAIPDDQAGQYEDMLVGVGRLIPLVDPSYRRVVTDLGWKQGLGELGSAASLVLAAAQRYGGDVHDTILAHDADLYRELINPDPVVNQTLLVEGAANNPSHFVLTVTTQEQLEKGGPFDTEGVGARVRRLRGHAGWMIAVVDAGEGIRRSSKGDLARADKALELAAGMTLNTVLDPVDPLAGDVQVIHSWYGMHSLLHARGLTPSETPPNEMSPEELLIRQITSKAQDTVIPEDGNRRSEPTVVALDLQNNQVDPDLYDACFRDVQVPINVTVEQLKDWTRRQGSIQSFYKDWLLPIATEIRKSSDRPEKLEELKHYLLRGVQDGLPEHVAMEYVRLINLRMSMLGYEV